MKGEVRVSESEITRISPTWTTDPNFAVQPDYRAKCQASNAKSASCL